MAASAVVAPPAAASTAPASPVAASPAPVVAKTEPAASPAPVAQATPATPQVQVAAAPTPQGNVAAPQPSSAASQSPTPAPAAVAVAPSPAAAVATTTPPQGSSPQQITVNPGNNAPIVATVQPQAGAPANVINIIVGGMPGTTLPAAASAAMPQALAAVPGATAQPATSATQPMALAASDNTGKHSTKPQRLPPLPGGDSSLAAYQQPLKLPIDDPELGGEKKNGAPKDGDVEGGEPARPAGQPPTIGQAPEQPRPQFLASDSILLDPGEYEFDITLQYAYDQADFASVDIRNNVLIFGEANRRQRLLTAPLEFRLGLSPVCQAFVNVPFGWSDSEFSFAGNDVFTDAGGIGDVSAGLIRQLIEGNAHCPTVLATAAFSAPTGKSTLATSLSVPGTALGEGFWTTSIGLSFIQIYDPIVVFYGFGYRHRYENEFEGGFEVEPGKQVYYRYGVGFAVNPRVTLTATFLGSYISEDVINGIRLAGGKREPMQLRLGATISRYTKKDECQEGPKTIEPFLVFGLTEESIDSVFGVSWTY